MRKRFSREGGSGRAQTYPGPRSPNRVMHVLESLAEFPDGLSLAKLGEVVGIPKTSLLSFLRVLEASGYVAKSNGAYTLGPLAFRLGLIIASAFKITSMLHPSLVQLAGRARETVMLGMLDETRDEACYIDIAQPDVRVRYLAQIGTRRPLYCTAIGRAILAYQDSAFLSRYMSKTKFVAHTSNTITNVGRLKVILEKVHASGVAVTRGEYDATTGAAAAPIFDREARVSFAVIIAAPAERLVAKEAELIPLVTEAGEQLSRVIGFPGRYPGRSSGKPALAAIGPKYQRPEI